jgi:anaerobic magnesium-protoporphyrin IX monomethyl ester cyclase
MEAATLTRVRPPRLRDHPDDAFSFELDPRIDDPASLRVTFVILLDGDLVMSPEHLGVALMAAVLRRAGFTATILEVEHEQLEAGVEAVVESDPSVVCFTLMSLNVQSCLSVAEAIKTRLPDTLLVAGGPAGTYGAPQLLRNNPYIDAVATGEGEPIIFELVRRRYLDEPLDDCPGLVVRDDAGTITTNPALPLIPDLDVLPFPVRDQLELHGNKLEYVRVSTSRGCVARCTFCSAPNISNRVQHGKAWRGRSVESVLDEVEHLVHTYNFRTYDFIDSTFEDPDGARKGKARARAIAEGILERNLDIFYNVCMRAENWSDDDHDLLDLLVRSGLEKVNIGIEAGNEQDLRLWDKLATVEDNIRVMRLLREHGIYLATGFIQFHPYATVETLTANADFLRQHGGGHNLRRLTERLEIYPGTVIVTRMEQDGLLHDRYYEELHPLAYSFHDEAVGKLAVHFQSLYNNEDFHERGVITEQSAVYKFETFNVVVQTFVSRSYRKFRTIPGAVEELERFKAALQEIRQECAAFNYAFFMDNLERVLEDRLDPAVRIEQVAEVERFFRDVMRRIRGEQLQTGWRLRRLGCDLGQIRSTFVERVPPEPAPRTYTGGPGPCW